MRVSATMRLSWPSVVPPPSARYRGYGGPCPAMRRPPTLQRCSMALGRHLSSVTPSRRALPSRQRRTWRPIDAGHSSTASPRRHQLSSYRNACRYWPGGRFRAPSLPESLDARYFLQRSVVTGLMARCPNRFAAARTARQPCLTQGQSAIARRPLDTTQYSPFRTMRHHSPVLP